MEEGDSDRIIVIDDDDKVCEISDDEMLAEELQLQEVIMSSTKSFLTLYDICEEVVPQMEVVQETKCDHLFCNACLTEYIDLELKKDIRMVKCRHESCKGVLEPKAHREIVSQKPKQKARPVRKIEKGECSKSTNDDFFCNICMESHPVGEYFAIASCGHVFCASCVAQYVSAKVEDNVVSIRCPDPDCKVGAVDPEMCRDILPGAVFHRWGWALCESSLGSKKFYCPYKDCSALLVDEGDAATTITDAECPHCNRMFCARCRVAWHDGIGCEEFEKLGKDERGTEDLMLRKLAADKKWQRCPQCKMFVEKIDGCMFMSCRCGYCFCYVCASPMSKEYHYCTVCNR
ncbi:uncharacterized protein [Typha latifolia]|uniref:uncharacterized protein isoform X2 n=1 Tax=Typha latifolia TaxID=4733 RepID=UPI003C2EA9CD